MKTAVSSYSFQRLIDAGTHTQFSIIEKAKEYGFDAIEFTDLTPPDGISVSDYAVKLRKEAERVGIEIACYSVCADLLNGSLEDAVAALKSKVDITELLGAKLLRHDVAFSFNTPREYRGFMNLLPRFADACRKVTVYAAEKGIRTMTENHGFFCQDSDRIEALVNTVAHPNFGQLVDMGNFLCVDESPATAVGRCAPYAFHVHVKDFLYRSGQEDEPGEGFFRSRGGAFLCGTVVGHGIVPIRQCVAALRSAGYDGYLTLEFEGFEELDYALRCGSKLLRRLCEK